jgi:hypothetical protein
MGDGEVQVTTDGRLWCAYNDQGIFGGSELESGGLVCLNLTGRLLFRYNQYDREEPFGADGMPEMFSVGGLNLVSDDEVWMSYHTHGSKEFYALVRLSGYRADRFLPWRIVAEQAPLESPLAFAILNDRLLTPGFVYGEGNWPPTANHPNARLFHVPLSGGGATEYLPVDENGNWIGSFLAYGRGSRLYLRTERGIYAVDMATLPDTSVS